ncbi:hypothetical protein [Demequina sp. NBRC 110053]|uniref:hypothetical protein n=1 Tax=Demequina sp. NBRC 110053 TaxID=1570342 RepID=UPI001F1F1385|nr:hypothetical protein [Demequina sp. NBRC 110053]
MSVDTAASPEDDGHVRKLGRDRDEIVDHHVADVGADEQRRDRFSPPKRDERGDRVVGNLDDHTFPKEVQVTSAELAASVQPHRENGRGPRGDCRSCHPNLPLM